MFKIYLAHPISGKSYAEVAEYYSNTTKDLQELGYEVLNPMTAKGYLRTEKKLRAMDYSNPASTNHAIIERDAWMVQQADVVYVNLMEAEEFSIGCVMELAWAHLLRKHTIIALPKDNPHRHAFVLEAADIVYEYHEDAMDYLELLAEGAE